MHSHPLAPLTFHKNDIPLKGEVAVAPDKSISHRSLIFASLAHGRTQITNLLEGEDVLKTAAALAKMGVEINKKSPGNWEVNGVGVVGLSEADDILDMGNSGTAARLLAGLVTPYDFTTFFTGDASLRKRPMARVFEPIKEIGARIVSRQNNLLPCAIIGAKDPLPITYKMKVASAQVKSCILLASLGIKGTTTIIEPQKCRDHSEIMMKYLGLPITVADYQSGTKISNQGLNEFDAKDLTVPGDISSAAFIIVAALLVKNSRVRINNVGLNPLRDGIIKTLLEMDANIKIENQREICGELVADILVEHSKLKGVEIPASRAPEMIDEYPILSVAAAFASGVTKMNGLAELKHKESNRLSAIATGLKNCGVSVKEFDDGLEIKGDAVSPKSLVKVKTSLDHRIAMSFLVMGLALENGIEVDDVSMIATSFPNFFAIFNKLRAGASAP